MRRHTSSDKRREKALAAWGTPSSIDDVKVRRSLCWAPPPG
jgi:hypothetical protein